MTNIAKMVQDDTNALHYATTVEVYRILLRSIMAKWDNMDCPALKEKWCDIKTETASNSLEFMW